MEQVAPPYLLEFSLLLKELFEELDTDKSGSISMSELSTGLHRQGYHLSENEIEQLMRK